MDAEIAKQVVTIVVAKLVNKVNELFMIFTLDSIEIRIIAQHCNKARASLAGKYVDLS